MIFVGLFLIGNLSGYAITKNNTNQKNIEYSNVPQTELSIYPYFFEVDSLKYKNNHLHSSVYLTEKGEIYNKTNLFTREYDITVSLINNDTEEAFAVFDKANWNINKDINIDINIASNQIKDETVLLELNKQLERMKKNEEHNIKYCIEIIPQNNADNIMRTIGILSM